jgi:hypothetical protein
MKFLHVRQNRCIKEIIPLFGAGVVNFDRFVSVPIIINNNVKSVQYKSYKFNLH